MERRIDKATASLIDAAVSVEAPHRFASVASELKAKGVPLHITIRVLTRLQERRSVPTLLNANR